MLSVAKLCLLGTCSEARKVILTVGPIPPGIFADHAIFLRRTGIQNLLYSPRTKFQSPLTIKRIDWHTILDL